MASSLIPRRAIFTIAASALPLLLGGTARGLADTAFNIPTAADSTNLPAGLLESRVLENVLSPPPYDLERSDIAYPAWLQGTWSVASKTASVEAPCGLAFFGTNRTFAAAQNEVGTTLYYECRFVRGAGDHGCIADRAYNVQNIAQAAFGRNSVVDIPVATPNKLTAIVAPTGAPTLLQVDLFTIRRRQETLDDTHFVGSEVVREIVSPVYSSTSSSASSRSSVPTVLKEVETTSLYTYDVARNRVTCRQRSAAFLLPSQSNPVQLRMWELSRGRPVDVRFYNVVYTKN